LVKRRNIAVSIQAMALNILILIAGLLVLIFGGDFLVRGASSLALKMNLSPLVVGLTVVAFGTSTPELIISVKAAITESPDLAMGNVIGSNICNLALVLGLTAIIFPINVKKNSIRVDWPMTMGSSLLLYLLVREGYINSYEGLIFVLILSLYIFLVIRKSRKDIKLAKELEQEFNLPKSHSTNFKDLSYIVLGSIGLFLGAELFVGNAQHLARYMGIEERIIGITVMALGTSLPELVTSSVASFKKETDLALGNLMGSNIFNILSILGITSIIKEIRVSDVIIQTDMIWMLGITLIILPMMLSKRQIGRAEGIILLMIYIYYTYTVVW
jgi:cation:H+ antiporter